MSVGCDSCGRYQLGGARDVKWGWLKDQGGASWCYIDVHYGVSCCFCLCHASKFSEKWGWFTNRVTLPQSWGRTAPNFLNTTQSTRSSEIFPIFWIPQIPHQVVPNARFTGGSITTEVVCEAARQVWEWNSWRATPKWYFFVGRMPKKHLYTFSFENII